MKNGKKFSLLIILLSSLVLSGCSVSTVSSASSASPVTEIDLWVYQIGNFGNAETVQAFIDDFQSQHPDIHVNVDYLDYTTGDDQVNASIAAGTEPDVIMEGPERLVTNWGAKGVMVELSDLWTDEALADINATNPVISEACRNSEGMYYEYPLCINAHCMAINYEMFAKAGALVDINMETHTWTTEQFVDACQKLAASGLCDTPGIVYCGGQGGDQGTRALITNMYGAQFTNADHTAYTINSEAGIKAMNELVSMCEEGVFSYNAGIQASDELKNFAQGSTAMSLAWNSSNEKSYADQVSFTPYTMTFPTDSGEPQLCGGIWGFGVFNSQDDARISAAKELIRFFCDDPVQRVKSVQAARSFPVRTSIGNPYQGTADEQRMSTYQKILSYLGDYYSITPGWSAQRTAWWTMLQQVFHGTDAQTAADQYVKIANAAIANEVK